MTASSLDLDTRTAYTAGLRALADLLDAHPELDSSYAFDRLLLPVSHDVDPRATLAAWLRAAKAAGIPVAKDYDEQWGSVTLTFAPGISLFVYAGREQVCERVVTGTREVTREVPDPDALAAVPKTVVTETVEDVEWVCQPLLATPAPGVYTAEQAAR